jgi:hypothetical protein
LAKTLTSEGHALKEMARCARHARDFGAARLAWEEILVTCGATGSAEAEVEAHNQLAEFSQLLGDHTAVISSLRKAAELRQRTGSALQAARQWLALASYLAWRIRLRDGLAALALARDTAEKAEHVGLLSEIFALEGFVLAMMAKHDEAQVRVDCSLELALNKWPSHASRHSLSPIGGPSGFQSRLQWGPRRAFARDLFLQATRDGK